MVLKSKIEKPLSFRLKSLFSTSSKGFSLVELAMVLVIVGIIVGVGVPLMRTLVTNIKYSNSRDIVQAAVDSVESWTAGNNLIPGTNFSSVVKNPNDAFAQPLVYVYDFNASGGNNITNICGIKTTSLSLKPSAAASAVNNVSFVVLSQADNHKVDSTVVSTGGATCANSTVPSAGCTDAVTGTSGTVTITADTANDIVQWVTIDELRTKIGCQGAQLAIINNELPYGYNQTGYAANIYATGGVPYTANPGGAGQFKWCVQNAQGKVFANLLFKDNNGTTFASTAFQQNCLNNKNSWIQSDYISISSQPVIIVGGTDSNLYICIASHVAASANQPITGANYSTYWQQVAGGTSSTWISGLYYPSGSNTLTIFVMDNNDPTGVNNNISQKTFVFTVNPS